MAMQARHVRGLGFVAALVVFVVGIALLMRKGGEGEGAEFESSASAPEDIGAGAEAPREDLNGNGSSHASRAALAVHEGEATAANEVREPGVELVPVVGVHRRRVAPVEMWWWEPKDPENWQELGQLERWLQSGEVDARIAELARKLEPDESGAFHAPTPDATGCVAARGEGLWGWTRVQRSSPDPTYIQLENDETLRVRVLDATGAAAPGVRVVLRSRWGPASSFLEDNDQAMVLTRPDGIALFPHFRAVMRNRWSYETREVVAVAEPFETPIEFEFDPTRPPAEPMELRLPPSGSVVLEIEGDDSGGQFSLRVTAPQFPEPTRTLVSPESLIRPAVRGEVHFPHVGLGLFLTPTSQVQGEARTHDESAAPGPTRTGELRRLRVVVHPTARNGMRAVGRLVGQAIRSFGTTRVDVAMHAFDAGDQPWEQNLRVVVTADGRFVIPLSREVVGRIRAEFTVLGPRDERAGDALTEATGRAGLLELDLGEIFVDSLPLLVSGRVVDATGRRAVGVQVRAFEWEMKLGTDRGRSGSWHTYTDFRGNFELRGIAESRGLAVTAWNEDASSEPQVIEPGTTDVVLKLGQDGGIAGTVRLDSGLVREYLTILVSRDDAPSGQQWPARLRHADVDAEGAFVVRGLEPGTYTVMLHMEGMESQLAWVRDVTVEAGHFSQDPRLHPLDPGEWIELRLVDAESSAGVYEAAAHLPDLMSGARFENLFFNGKFLYQPSWAPFWVRAPHYLDEPFDPSSRASTLRLERAPVVQVQVEEELLSSRGFTQFLLSFQSTDSAVQSPRGRPIQVAIRDPLSKPFELRCARSYSTRLMLNGYGDLKIPYELVGNVSTTAGQTPQVLELRWKPEDLAEELDRARSRNPSHVNQGSGKR